LSKIDLRVFAIETVYRSGGNLIPGVDGTVIKRENLLSYLDFLKFNELLKYKSKDMRKVYIPETKDTLRTFCVPCISDRIVQTLFVQLIDPILDV